MRCLKFAVGLVLCHLLITCPGLQAATTVDQLRCEQLVNPQGIDATQPRLSWVLESSRHDVKQSAYEILVASSEQKLAQDTGDLWDSGKVISDQSILVPYAGSPLASRAACCWKVRVWDGGGKASVWSRPAYWTMGLLSAEEWHARWIGQDGTATNSLLTGTSWIWYPEGEPQVAAPIETNYFRRVVALPPGRAIKRAVFEYTGDNECRGWLDGFDLGARNNFKSVKWNDITARLEPGKSYVFGLTGRNEGAEPNPAGAIGLLTIEFADGGALVIPTDDQWKVSKTPEPGWTTAGFDDSQWVAAKVLGPAGMEPWGEARVPEDRRLAARYLRKDFAVEKTVTRATVSFCGLGLSELYLNGHKIGDAVLSPAFAQYDKREFYVTYDVTPNVKPGANALGVILGNGRFYADRSKVYTGTVTFGYPKLLLNLRLQFSDGSAQEIVSDESWKLTTNGPIVANNDYDGEEYDARKEFAGWDRAGFDDSIWPAAQVVAAPGGVLSAQMIQPIRVTGTLQPVHL
jgi:alpha-L-rhamnosidase